MLGGDCCHLANTSKLSYVRVVYRQDMLINTAKILSYGRYLPGFPETRLVHQGTGIYLLYLIKPYHNQYSYLSQLRGAETTTV